MPNVTKPSVPPNDERSLEPQQTRHTARLGYAMIAIYPPDVAFANHFLALQQEARDANRGLWDACVGPIATPTATPVAPAVCSCSGNLYNCADFSSHAAAQACYEYCWNVVGYDIHRLDGDDDGVACESPP